jgi:ubiquinone/menaquinone biosynthesis C-methylase UbiE
MKSKVYIHGTDPSEQERLILLNRLTNSAFISFLDISEKSRILDVGAGTGILAGQVATIHGDSTLFTVEISTEQLNKRQQNLNNLHSLQGDAHNLPFLENRFDVAYCRYLLEHVLQPIHVLKEIYRVLKPGGKFYIQENNILVHVFYPDCPYFTSVWQKFVQLQKSLGGDAEIGKRLFLFLKQTGFQKIQLSIQPEIHAAGSQSFSNWVENIIGNIRSGEQLLLEHGFVNKHELQQAFTELQNLVKRDDSAAYFYWNRASAEK